MEYPRHPGSLLDGGSEGPQTHPGRGSPRVCEDMALLVEVKGIVNHKATQIDTILAAASLQLAADLSAGSAQFSANPPAGSLELTANPPTDFAQLAADPPASSLQLSMAPPAGSSHDKKRRKMLTVPISDLSSVPSPDETAVIIPEPDSRETATRPLVSVFTYAVSPQPIFAFAGPSQGEVTVKERLLLCSALEKLLSCQAQKRILGLSPRLQVQVKSLPLHKGLQLQAQRGHFACSPRSRTTEGCCAYASGDSALPCSPH